MISQIIPIYIISILGMGLAGGYVLRLATQHPEVSWTKSNSEPWNDYKNRQYKVGHDDDYMVHHGVVIQLQSRIFYMQLTISCFFLFIVCRFGT